MSLLNSFIHGEALTEILVEGHNPHAQQKLSSADLDALRQQMFSTEQLQAYVLGRIVGAGRGVWALSDQAVLLQGEPSGRVRRIPLVALRGFETERGRYGHTVRLFAEGGAWSLYGVDRELAGFMHAAFVARGISSRFDERPPRTHGWQQAGPAGWAADCLRDARLRLGGA